MELGQYLAILRRRWWLVALIIIIDVIVSLGLYVREHRSAGSQACLTLYVADVSAPSLIAAPNTTLQTEGQLLAGETAANFFGDDILDVAQSSRVATFISNRLRGRGLPTTDFASVNGSIGGSRKDRTVNLCTTNPNAQSALAVAQ